MTEKLKTLKDFKVKGKYNPEYIRNIVCDELRAEAVKWVRFSRTQALYDRNKKLEDWILHFFNLTEEDLK